MKLRKCTRFPAVMTALAALCFWIVYVLLLAEPYPLYLEGLLFALPALTLGATAWLSQKEWISDAMSVHLTIWLSLFSVFLSLWYGAFLLFRVPFE